MTNHQIVSNHQTVNSAQLKHKLAEFKSRCETILAEYLSNSVQQQDVQKHSDLYDAIVYACGDGGKRLRASLVYSASDIYDENLERFDAPACAVELIHCYSLVHDDMPEMDNDQFRRGKLSTHAKYNQTTALLVGDNLQTLAFDILSNTDVLINSGDLRFQTAECRLKMVQCLAKASGIHGMIGGQAIDLALDSTTNGLPDDIASEDKKAELMQDLKTLHLMKTGALITASLQLGALAAKASDSDINALTNYGHHIGLLFQITDDILDETSNDDTLGKTVGKDKALNKLTYATLLGLKQAKLEADIHCKAAKEALVELSKPAPFLLQLADFIRNRQK